MNRSSWWEERFSLPLIERDKGALLDSDKLFLKGGKPVVLTIFNAVC